MEVIENKGIPKVRGECWCCGSTLAFTLDNVESTTHRNIDGTKDYERYIICSECGSKTVLIRTLL